MDIGTPELLSHLQYRMGSDTATQTRLDIKDFKMADAAQKRRRELDASRIMR